MLYILYAHWLVCITVVACYRQLLLWLDHAVGQCLLPKVTSTLLFYPWAFPENCCELPGELLKLLDHLAKYCTMSKTIFTSCSLERRSSALFMELNSGWNICPSLMCHVNDVWMTLCNAWATSSGCGPGNLHSLWSQLLLLHYSPNTEQSDLSLQSLHALLSNPVRGLKLVRTVKVSTSSTCKIVLW